jgi:uncharacterized protein YcsI (UPF0317 family)
MSKLLSKNEMLELKPSEFRKMVSRGEFSGETTQVCKGSNQANMAILPKDQAFDFLVFCLRNPQPCPVMDVTEAGDPHPRLMAPGADLRTDLPRYRVYQDGRLIDEPTDVSKYWRDDLVAFLLGCSIGFDWALKEYEIPYRLTGIYTSNIPLVPAGSFRGPMVVSGRVFYNCKDAIRAAQISSRYPASHGSPVHFGNPAGIGIPDFTKPDIAVLGGKIEPLQNDHVTVFWGCGVTPQAVAVAAKTPFMITHYPANMFVTDKTAVELTIF